MAYYVRIADKKYGPFDAEKIRRLVSAGKVSRDDSISKDQANWIPAGNVKGLFPQAELVVPEQTAPEPIPVIVREPSEDLVIYTAQATRDAAASAARATGQLTAKGAGIIARGTIVGAKAIGNAAKNLKLPERPSQADAPQWKVSAFIRESLTPSEEIIYVAKVHPAMIYGPVVELIVFGLIAIASLVAAAFLSAMFLFVVVVPVSLVFLLRFSFVLLKAIVSLKTTECVLTNQRIIGKYGFITRNTMELFLVKVESVTVRQGLWGRMLGYGSVVITGTGNSPSRFLGIEEPQEFRKQVQAQIALKTR